MLHLLRFFFIVVCCLLQSCKHADDVEDTSMTKNTDLSKAATFNMQLGLGYLKQGERSRAKRKLLTAYEQEPKSPDVNAALGYYYEQSSEIDEARKYYLKAISLSSNAGAQLNNYGTFLCRQGDYKGAETYFLRAVKDMQYVNTAAAYENAGLCSMAMPDMNKAKVYFTHALKHDPSRRESLLELVKIDSKIGLDTEALHQLQKYPELVLTDKEFLELAKEIALKTGDQKLANQYNYYYENMGLNTGESGVDHEYNNHNG